MGYALSIPEEGGSAVRPILLTVVLSIGGLLPQAINGGNLWPPMAWALIAGLLGSLVLTLVVIPSVYAVLAGKGEQTEPRHGRNEKTVSPATNPA